MELTTQTKDKKLRRKLSPDLSTMVYGKLPPQAKDLEEAVLGAVMLEKNVFSAVSEILRPECFYVDAHQKIFDAMFRLEKRNQPIDILTVVEELKATNELEVIGGAYYISKLTNMVKSSANVESHARILVQKFIQRELIRVSGEIIGQAYEDTNDVFELLNDAESKYYDITKRNFNRSYKNIGQVLVQTYDTIQKMKDRHDELSGVPSGFMELDKLTNGWQRTDLIVLAARPGVGKTAFALNLAHNAALHATHKVPIAFFSLEMSAEQLVQRVLAAESEIPLESIKRARLQESEIEQLYEKGIKPLAHSEIFIDDSPMLNIFELRAKCRKLKLEKNIGIIFIDYLQLMMGVDDKGFNRSNREQEISTISRSLKALAKELEIPIVALAQLNRTIEGRQNKIPQLSDLRESGAIEQDADLVMFLYSQELHDINQDTSGESVKEEIYLRVAKHRNGETKTVNFRFLKNIQKFVDNRNTSNYVVQRSSKMNDSAYDFEVEN